MSGAGNGWGGRETVATAVLCGLIAFALGQGKSFARRELPAPGLVGASGAGRLVGRGASFIVQPSLSRITARTHDASYSLPVVVRVSVDGQPRAIPLARLEPLSAETVGDTFRMDLEDGSLDVTLSFRLDDADEALVCHLKTNNVALARKHALAIELELEGQTKPVFVSGVGEVADLGTVPGRAALVEDDVHPVGLVSTRGLVETHRRPADGADEQHGTGPLRLSFRSPPIGADETGDATDLHLLLGSTTQSAWRKLFVAIGSEVASVRGYVTGATSRERVLLFGLDAVGKPRVRAVIDDNGHFDLDVPKTITRWYAALDPSRTSAPVFFEPGTPRDLKLDLSPGGELRVRVIDADTGEPLTARLVVSGDGDTMDPSFGPDYRASGAGPIVDALRGEVVTPLPAGRYRIAATKGLEWSVDAKLVDIGSGRSVGIELAPRHVVPTPHVLGADLHVHARPSFDSPVSVEDRVLSLVAAGVEFAVPTEHNVVGDYELARETLSLGHELISVTGVEITTFAPSFGHFGIFPYPLETPVPKFRNSTLSTIFQAARRASPDGLLQVHHPRLDKIIGYFEYIGFDPKKPPPPRMRTDFDGIEVYNGYEMNTLARVEVVLRDYFALLNQGRRYVATGSSDSHSIQYHWAGYPRTMVHVGPEADEDLNELDPTVVVGHLKRGHAVITSGPMIELDAEGSRPGDDAYLPPSVTPHGLRARITVRAAPWIDVSNVELVVDGKRITQLQLPPHKTKIGPEPGTIEEAAARTLRYEGELFVPIPNDGRRHWFLVMARGSKNLDEVLAFMPLVPMALTNPIWVIPGERPPATPTDSPAVGPTHPGTR